MIMLSDIVLKIQCKNIKIGDVREIESGFYKIEDIIGGMMDVIVNGNRKMSWYTHYAIYDPLIRRS